MKRTITLVAALSLMGVTVAMAQPGGPGNPGQQPPDCGKPGQPACVQQGSPPGDQQRRRRDRRKGQSPQSGPPQPPAAQPPPPVVQPGPPSAPQPTGPRRPRFGNPPTPQPPVVQPSPPAPPFIPPRQRVKPPVMQLRPPAPPTPPPVVQPPVFRSDGRRWSRGDRLPERFRREAPPVQDWRRHNLSPPPNGYHWVCQRGGHCFLVADRTGIIREARWRDDRENYWRRRYLRRYSYNDDIYYRECRGRPDPAGVFVSGLIGELLGGAISGDDGDAVFAGIIINAFGAALTSDMECDDRSYAYYAYYHGLNSGRPGVYRWRNPRNNHRGDFYVRGYYYDPYGFNCASYTNTLWLGRRHIASGQACRQPNGAWAFLN